MTANPAALSATLVDGDLVLEPLSERHRVALRAACAEDPAIWPIYGLSYDPDHFDTNFDILAAGGAKIGFAIMHRGVLAGMSAYLAIEGPRAVVEIGNSYIAPAYRGSGLNDRFKRLMIDHAFACGFRRVEFRVDVRNGRSMAAVAKIGGVKEGVLRQERITWTGHVRDTALFSILSDEWSARD
jgi:RimJ/RimL family protein N-acetyltransferase